MSPSKPIHQHQPQPPTDTFPADRRTHNERLDCRLCIACLHRSYEGQFGWVPYHAREGLTPCVQVSTVISQYVGGAGAQSRGRSILSNEDSKLKMREAILMGDPVAMRSIIENGADIDMELSGGKTALFWAITLGELPMVRELLQLGADPNVKNADGDAPLHAAAHLGDALSTALLLEMHAHVDIRGRLLLTPLHHAAFGDSSEKYLKESLSFAVGGYQASKEVSGDGFISPQDSLLARFQSGRVPNHLAVMSLLLGKGADPDAVSDAGEAPLHFVAVYDHFQAASLLIQSGADIEIEDTQRERPLHEGVAYGARGVVGILLKSGADTYATEEHNLNSKEFICHCHTYTGNRTLNPCGPSMCMSTYDVLVIESMIDKARGV